MGRWELRRRGRYLDEVEVDEVGDAWRNVCDGKRELEGVGEVKVVEAEVGLERWRWNGC